MRFILMIFLVACMGFSCVKKTPSNPTPEIEFKDFKLIGGVGTDSALFTIGYKDWDGDLFSDTQDQTNIVFRTYAFNKDSLKFISDGDPFGYSIIQPAEGYYKGKSIQGDIFVHVGEFRSDPLLKEIKFEIFMQDMKGNKSNVITTPTFTLS